MNTDEEWRLPQTLNFILRGWPRPDYWCPKFTDIPFSPHPHLIEGQGQLCTSYSDITSSDIELFLDTSGNPCIRCLDINGIAQSNTVFSLNGELVLDNHPIFGVINGVLRLHTSQPAIPGRRPFSGVLKCQVVRIRLTYSDIRVFSTSKYHYGRTLGHYPCFVKLNIRRSFC